MQLRAPTIDDARAALDVLVARDIADLGVPDYTLGDVLDVWHATDLDLERPVGHASAEPWLG